MEKFKISFLKSTPTTSKNMKLLNLVITVSSVILVVGARAKPKYLKM